MLTYETLRAFITKERASKGFAELPKDFFEDAEAYLAVKKKLKNNWEAESAERLFQDLLEIREKKLLLSAFYYVRSGVFPEYLTERERLFFEKLVQDLRAFQKPDQKTTRMLQDIPAFVGPDMKTYGPYQTGQTVSLPGEIERLLLEKKAISKE